MSHSTVGMSHVYQLCESVHVVWLMGTTVVREARTAESMVHVAVRICTVSLLKCFQPTFYCL